jgi:adenosylmethionine-8-amino-7-oxononanoate aminotransferase
MNNVPPDKRWMHAYTYSGHPSCCAVALANIGILEREGLVERAATLGRRLLDGLRGLAPLPGVGDVRGLGMMAAIELVADKATKQPCPPAANVGPRVAGEMLKRGLYTRVVGETICLAPPLVTTHDQVDQIVEIVGAAITAVQQ